MPIKFTHNSPQADEVLPDIAQSLASVVELVRTTMGGGSLETDKLALIRVLEGVPLKKWEELTASGDLPGWVAVPLEDGMASTLASLLSVQKHYSMRHDYDSLTGIGNRRQFDRCLEEEIMRATRSHTECSLLILDIDDFKHVNDTHGHSAGDRVLRHFGSFLKQSIRPYSIVTRLEGERFAAILPGMSCWTALRHGNHLLEFFQKEVFHCKGGAFSLTFSAGIASLSMQDKTPNATLLLQSASQALYAAKRNGKKRVTIAETTKRAKDRASLVDADEKQFLFSTMGLE